jgi:hypothetical protein
LEVYALCIKAYGKISFLITQKDGRTKYHINHTLSWHFADKQAWLNQAFFGFS